jgi:hypothetical protein
VEVVERVMARHQQGIAEAIHSAGDDLRGQLRGIAAWLLAHPPVDLIRMAHSDAPALDPQAGENLLQLAFASLLMPIVDVLRTAQTRGEIAHPDLGNIAGALFSALEGLHTLPQAYLERPRQEMAHDIIDVFIAGLQRPSP